ncbi:flagellar hook-associated protein FlgK [Rhodovarius lipocyclicus]|uniref:flagellar hook-associated protein FlgK n=1 Tax=Rhodovarius lipocyclicus TaxID=268410 RepID=UPI00135BD845|nr:flagellar basal body rod C-terminal domain-containing protein [Rhodovarius lipocyclicus]
MSLDTALSIARSGLAATQRQLALASQNVANATTAGYTRKTLTLTSQDVNGLALGVRTGEATRTVDQALINERNNRNAASEAYTVRDKLLAGVEAVYGQPTDGNTLGNAINAIQSAFTKLRDAPSDTGIQREALTAANNAVTLFHEAGQAILGAREQAQTGIETEVQAVNDSLRTIAGLTDQIRNLTASGISTADLEDKRDQAIAKLSESLPVQTVKQSDGGVVLLGRNGVNLNLPTHGEDILSVDHAEVGADSYYGATGTLPGVTMGGVDITGQLSGGRLTENIVMRDQVLPRMMAEVDVAASELASRLDAVGLTLFTDASGTVPDPSAGYVAGNELGFSLSIQVNTAVSSDLTKLRDGTHNVTGSATGPSAFTTNPAGGPTGFTTLIDRVLNNALGSEAQTGVAWASFPSTGLGPDGTLSSSLTASRTLTDYAAQVSSSHANTRAEAVAAQTSAAALRDALTARIDAKSSVDSDTEMSNLVKLQNAYAANARVMTTVQSMYDALMAAVR